MIRIRNFVRCVRGGAVRVQTEEDAEKLAVSDAKKEKRDSGNAFVRREDRNGDGKVSRDEFGGPPEHFDMFDRNRDGFLTEEEAPKGPPPSFR